MKPNQFRTTVAGIPCICEVTHYTPARPAIITADPDDSSPPEPAEFEYRILDRKGYTAPWLERKVSQAIIERLADEWEATILEQKHYINERD